MPALNNEEVHMNITQPVPTTTIGFEEWNERIRQQNEAARLKQEDEQRMRLLLQEFRL